MNSLLDLLAAFAAPWLALAGFVAIFVAPFVLRDRRAARKRRTVVVPVPRDPAGWGWITDAERARFEDIAEREGADAG